MAEENETDNVGGRILVGVFALGIVLIGLHPLKRGSESFYAWLTRDSVAQVKNVVRQLQGLAPITLVPAEIPLKAKTSENRTQVVVGPTRAVDEKDSLNRKDREELNKLIADVAGGK